MSSLSRPLNSLFDSVARSKGAGILFADEAETCSGEVAEDTVNRLAGGLLEMAHIHENYFLTEGEMVKVALQQFKQKKIRTGAGETYQRE